MAQFQPAVPTVGMYPVFLFSDGVISSANFYFWFYLQIKW